jgi:hypothetical protein
VVDTLRLCDNSKLRRTQWGTFFWKLMKGLNTVGLVALQVIALPIPRKQGGMLDDPEIPRASSRKEVGPACKPAQWRSWPIGPELMPDCPIRTRSSTSPRRGCTMAIWQYGP